MDGLDALIRSFARLGDDTAAAGIFGDEENATKAAFAEFGTVTAPPRPFMSRAAIFVESGGGGNGGRDKAGRFIKGAGSSSSPIQAAAAGFVEAAANGLTVSPALAIAEVLASAMREQIDKGVPPPLAESTLAARRSRGNSDTTPLRDTGAMRASIRSKAGPGEGGGSS